MGPRIKGFWKLSRGPRAKSADHEVKFGEILEIVFGEFKVLRSYSRIYSRSSHSLVASMGNLVIYVDDPGAAWSSQLGAAWSSLEQSAAALKK